MKILILKPSSLGDVVHALPVLRHLKAHRPESEIYWWIDAQLVPLLEGDPDLTGLIPFERKRWANPLRWSEAWHSLRRIRAHRFDWVIDLQSLLRSGAVAWLASGAFTIGLDDAREGARAFYDVAVPRPSPSTHAVDWYLRVLTELGVPQQPQFQWLPQRPAAAAAIRSRWPVDSARWIALQPGARWLNKRWPIEHFAELARLLAHEFDDVRFAILGSAADRPLAETLVAADRERCVDLTGRTSLPETIEWLRASALLVTNDTGPMHLAAALGRPVVALFGPTDPHRTGPYGQAQNVIRHPLECSPCLKDRCAYEKPMECLRAISPAMVFERVRSLLTAANVG